VKHNPILSTRSQLAPVQKNPLQFRARPLGNEPRAYLLALWKQIEAIPMRARPLPLPLPHDGSDQRPGGEPRRYGLPRPLPSLISPSLPWPIFSIPAPIPPCSEASSYPLNTPVAAAIQWHFLLLIFWICFNCSFLQLVAAAADWRTSSNCGVRAEEGCACRR
jgi:hypothetical protein